MFRWNIKQPGKQMFWNWCGHYQDIVSWEPEGRYCISKMFRWEPEGRYRCTKSMAIAPFWFSTEHPWIQITPFWLSTDDIYDWISPLNKRSGRPFILTQQSIGRSEYGIAGHLHISAFLKHLMVLLRCNFFRASFLHLIKDTDTCRDM